jgi:hypothetical protein
MFAVLYTVNLSMCIYDVFNILLFLWHTYGSMEYMYILMYVCMYVCMYVICMYYTAVTSAGLVQCAQWKSSTSH